MRITLTGRRLALAAVLVLGGVAAPLAYATIGDTKAPAASAVAATTLSTASSTSVQAGTAVADNPYQFVYRMETYLLRQCGSLQLPSGQDFALKAVTVVLINGTMKSAAIGPEVVLPGGGAGGTPAVTIPIGQYGGTQAFDLVVRPRLNVEGTVYDLIHCVEQPTPDRLDYLVIVTGQKIVGPSAAVVMDFHARSRTSGTTLRWTTASETTILGFNVWRFRGAKGVKVNRTLVHAKRSGEPAGASYRFDDQVAGAKRGLTYRLQLVDLKGKRTWYAAFAIASK